MMPTQPTQSGRQGAPLPGVTRVGKERPVDTMAGARELAEEQA